MGQTTKTIMGGGGDTCGSIYSTRRHFRHGTETMAFLVMGVCETGGDIFTVQIVSQVGPQIPPAFPVFVSEMLACVQFWWWQYLQARAPEGRLEKLL